MNHKLPGYILIVIVSITLLFPIYWMFTGSFSPIEGILRQPPSLWPRTLTVQNYRTLLSEPLLLRWLFNTSIVIVGTVAASTLVSLLGGYGMSKDNAKIVKVAAAVFLTTIMVPRTALLIPWFTIIRKVGLSGTLAATILPAALYPVGIFLYRTHIRSIPQDIMDAAKIDGASEWQIVRMVVLPLTKAATGVVAVTNFIAALVDFMWQFLVLQSVERRTLIVGLMAKIMTNRGGNAEININPIGLQMAAGCIIFIPLLLIFIFFQRYFTSGIMAGGIKE